MTADPVFAAPRIDRTFAAVRAALPAENAAAFDAELEAIMRAPVVDLAALDGFLAGWHRIAIRIAGDPGDWQRVLRLAADLESGARRPGRPMAEVLAEQAARRGLRL